MGLLIFGVILFVIILLHEAGHLIMAKKYGVRVKTYSIGFGPRIIGIKFYKKNYSIRIGKFMPTNSKVWFRKDNTEYRIAPIPLGGFCSLEGELKGTGKSYELASKPFIQKLQIALAGVVTNIITGMLVLFGIGIKHNGFITGIKLTAQMIYQTVVALAVALSQAFSGGLEISTASDVNQIMTGISFEIVLLYFGIFSIVMALVNAIPFPALDGSLPFLWILEKITKGKISKQLYLVWFMGFVVLMILQVVILYFWIFG